ncbi:MAG: hypothetical protein M1822_002513 [Bathelium mastoideum]|nr:MAG: hypothetical protein M1822_002513 [Bathelium mastoideum]
MAFHTPRRLQRLPSLGNPGINTASTPNLNHSATLARQKSLSALTAGPQTPASKMAVSPDGGYEVGDTVDVPGGMWGVVKFIGTVKGKAGLFAGVELDRQFAGKGKNDGDVDGVRYFTTTIPGAGIFLPTKRASKRASVMSVDSFPPTPTTPSFTKLNHAKDDGDAYTPPTPAMPMSKFSQTVGPGARAPSPHLKPRSRPSLPRPESPFRKQPNLQPTPSRTGSIGPRGGATTPRFTASPAPPRSTSTASRSAVPPRPFSRNNSSRLGHRDVIDEDGETTPVGLSRGASRSSGQEDEAQRLRKKLEDRDRQLKDQATSLAEMESSLAELQSLLPSGQPSPSRSRRPASAFEDADAAQLRSLLREKNDKISMLTAEFDAHRADFRSTIDTLEMASTETERVYEKRVEDLLQEIRELQEGRDDVESVAQQLKQLEELVQELEEGLEDARRGEAEARGEVEFLRGEVERGRSELRREREKAAAALKGAGAAMDGPLMSPGGGGGGGHGAREVEQRDDEIRGLKAIIHSLSSGPDLGATSSPRADAKAVNGLRPGSAAGAGSAELPATVARLERERDELRGLVDRKTFREEELERELDRLRATTTAASSHRSSATTATSRTPSDNTLQPESKRASARDSRGTVVSWRDTQSSQSQQQQLSKPLPLEPTPEAASSPAATSDQTSSTLWCEFCETSGSHDILSCPKMPASADGSVALEGEEALRKEEEGEKRQENGEENGVMEPEAAEDEWCALCEQDGHNATNCTMPSF